ncbi:MAG: hypothetical protein RIR00_748 [Pseudomonadota bacterium]
MKILVIRRENIGDLVCITPLLHALRQQLPTARIQALVTRYNAPVLQGNPDLDAVHAYQKAKHRTAGETLAGIYWDRLKTVLYLRRQRFDYVLLPGGAHASALRFARMIAPRQVLVRDDQDRVAGPHEVQQCCHLLLRMGLQYQEPATRVVADPVLRQRVRGGLGQSLDGAVQRIGVHISARKLSQRWPAERFAELINRLNARPGVRCLLFWSPGAADDPKHPGDDAKAEAVIRQVTGEVLPVPTGELDQLIAALDLCDSFICADGGAMHLAAALGKPMVCLFGDSDTDRWHPWGNRSEVLQPASRHVQDISVAEVLDALARLTD